MHRVVAIALQDVAISSPQHSAIDTSSVLICTPIDLSIWMWRECSVLTCTPIDLSYLDVEGVLSTNVHTNRPLLSGCGGSAQY